MTSWLLLMAGAIAWAPGVCPDDHGGLEVGDVVRVGRPPGGIEEGDAWGVRAELEGLRTRVVSVGIDDDGCAAAEIDLDGGEHWWRVDALSRARWPRRRAVRTAYGELAIESWVAVSERRWEDAAGLYRARVALARRWPAHIGFEETVDSLGLAELRAGRALESVAAYVEALDRRLARLGRHPESAVLANNLGHALEFAGAYEQAEVAYGLALDIDLETDPDNHVRLSTRYNNLGVLHGRRGRTAQAIEVMEQALASTEAGWGPEHPESAAVLGNLGAMHLELHHPEEALRYGREALSILRAARGPGDPSVGMALNNVGHALGDLERLEEAEATLREALTILESSDTPLGREHLAIVLSNLAGTLMRAGRLREARGPMEESLDRLIEVLGPDHPSVAHVHNGLAGLVETLGEVSTAEGHYLRALEISRDKLGGDHPFTLTTQTNLARNYQTQGRYDEALPLYEAVTEARREVFGDNSVEVGNAYGDLGTLLFDLGARARARLLLEQAVRIAESRGEPGLRDWAQWAVSLGSALQVEGEHEAAEAMLVHAVKVAEDLVGPTHTLVARGLNSLANVNLSLGRNEIAIELFERTLAIDLQVFGPDHPELALARLNLSAGLHRAGRLEESLSVLATAFADGATNSNPHIRVVAYEAAGLAAMEMGDDALAVFHVKQAVRVAQEMEAASVGLDADLRGALRTDVAPLYRMLAELLLWTDRFIEAEAVLDLLKEAEYDQFARGRHAAGRVPMSAAETEWADRLDTAREGLVEVGAQVRELRGRRRQAPLSAAEASLLTALEHRLGDGRRDFLATLDAVRVEAGSRANATSVVNLDDLDSRDEELGRLADGTVLVTTFVGESEMHVFLSTGGVQLHRSVEVSSGEVSKQVSALRSALRDPRSDPREPARWLFDRTLGLVEDELVRSDARVVLTSLDGVLRYVPMAALHDGERWVAERWATPVFTRAVANRMDEPAPTESRVAAFGTTQAHTVQGELYPALASVRGEVDAVVDEDGRRRRDDGALPGIARLDAAFDVAALAQALDGDANIVHLASHFAFRPGAAHRSFLVLGTGDALTLEEVRASPDLGFGGVDLVTLSACETGVGGSTGDGAEVEGFGTLVQRRGGRSVLASLWRVSDASTSAWMSSMYRLRAAGASKAEAVRQTQLAMLRGELAPGGEEPSVRGVAVAVAPDGSWAHPYHWAPFVLIGAWR